VYGRDASGGSARGRLIAIYADMRLTLVERSLKMGNKDRKKDKKKPKKIAKKTPDAK
jgi:hypothetical protein